MPRRLPADVVVQVPVLPRRPIEIRRRKTCKDGNRALEISPHERRSQIFELHPAALVQIVEVRVDGDVELRRALVRFLPVEASSQVEGLRGVRGKPARVEDLEVVGIDRRPISARERVTGEKDREGSTAGEPSRLGDHPLEREIVAIVTIDGIEAGGAARRIVGLRTDIDRQRERIEVGYRLLGIAHRSKRQFCLKPGCPTRLEDSARTLLRR